MSLKILFLSHKFYPDIGGIETITEILAREFSEAGHEVRVLTWSLDPTGKTFPFVVIRNPGQLRLIQEHSWANIIFENNICLRLSWPKIFFDRPSIIGLQTWLNRVGGNLGWQDRFKLKFLKHASGVVACSDAIRRRCWPEAVTIGNPYEENIFRMIPSVPRNSHFVFLGRLVSDKGASLAIEAFYNLVKPNDKQNPIPDNLSLTIIGDGPERESLKNSVARLGLEKRVVFKGALRGEELVNCLNQHRFLLVPSMWEEPFGIVALEGMACGCIPIVADGGGLPDAVGKAGLTFTRGSVDALVSSIREVLQNSVLEQHLREEASKHLKAHHPDKVASQYLKVIETAALK